MANKSRPKQVIFRVSEEEAKLIQGKIEKSGKNQQEYLLRAVLDKPIMNTDGIKELMPELKRQGNNLNQMAKALNEIDVALKDSGFYSYKKIAEVLAEVEKSQEEHEKIWQQLNQYLQSVQ